jgi:hypothetical protein
MKLSWQWSFCSNGGYSIVKGVILQRCAARLRVRNVVGNPSTETRCDRTASPARRIFKPQFDQVSTDAMYFTGRLLAASRLRRQPAGQGRSTAVSDRCLVGSHRPLVLTPYMVSVRFRHQVARRRGSVQRMCVDNLLQQLVPEITNQEGQSLFFCCNATSVSVPCRIA